MGRDRSIIVERFCARATSRRLSSGGFCLALITTLNIAKAGYNNRVPVAWKCVSRYVKRPITRCIDYVRVETAGTIFDFPSRGMSR